MPFQRKSDFTYEIKGINRIIEERGNQFIRFAQIAWGTPKENEQEKIKYDLRKYVTDPNGNEKMLKGVSFLTDNGPHELAHVLVEEGFGNTEKILRTIQQRPDFKSAVNNLSGMNPVDNSQAFDLRSFLDR